MSKAELKRSLNKWSVLVGHFSTSVSYLTINSMHAESPCLMVAKRATKELLTPTPALKAFLPTPLLQAMFH